MSMPFRVHFEFLSLSVDPIHFGADSISISPRNRFSCALRCSMPTSFTSIPMCRLHFSAVPRFVPSSPKYPHVVVPARFTLRSTPCQNCKGHQDPLQPACIPWDAASLSSRPERHRTTTTIFVLAYGATTRFAERLARQTTRIVFVKVSPDLVSIRHNTTCFKLLCERIPKRPRSPASSDGCVHACICVSMYAYIHACMSTRGYECMFACMYLCMYICMHVCNACMYVGALALCVFPLALSRALPQARTAII